MERSDHLQEPAHTLREALSSAVLRKEERTEGKVADLLIPHVARIGEGQGEWLESRIRINGFQIIMKYNDGDPPVLMFIKTPEGEEKIVATYEEIAKFLRDTPSRENEGDVVFMYKGFVVHSVIKETLRCKTYLLKRGGKKTIKVTLDDETLKPEDYLKGVNDRIRKIIDSIVDGHVLGKLPLRPPPPPQN
jgi:hypothetical protein